MDTTFVTKRDGTQEEFKFDKISTRLSTLKQAVENFHWEQFGVEKKLHVNVVDLTRKIFKKDLPSQVSTADLDYIAAEAAAFTPYHPDYQYFAGCILASNHQKCNKDVLQFRQYVKKARSFFHPLTKKHCPLVSDFVAHIAQDFGKELEGVIKHDRDLMFDFFAMQTLLRSSYLLGTYHTKTKTGDRVFDIPSVVPFETPQHYFMRVAIGLYEGIFYRDPALYLGKIKETYNMMSLHEYTHATPTMFHCGTPHPTLISCFLLTMGRDRDSVEGMYDTVKECALISKGAGGIGVDITDVRPRGSYIKGTNGISNGLTPFIRVFNDTARHIDQGGGKRKGAFAIYLEPWHADFMEWLDLKKNTGKEEDRARDLFYGVYACRLFFKRWAEALQRRKVQNKETVWWSFFDPHVCPGLTTTFGDEFEALYTKYEEQGMYTSRLDIMEIKEKLLATIIETGGPYLLNKDEINEKSNQSNLGMVRSSNLCVAFDTPLLTRKGYFPIGELQDQDVEVWNGQEWSKTTVKQTSPMAQVMKIEFSDGSHLVCTPEHHFYIQEGKEAAKKVEAQMLKPGQKLMSFTLPAVESYCETKEEQWQKFRRLITQCTFSQQGELIFKDSREQLEQIRRELHTLGVFPWFQGDLLVAPPQTTVGFMNQQGHTELALEPMQSEVYVTAVEHDYGETPTFCFTEPQRNMGVFNGILTGNCVEITEVAEPGKPASCNLCSLNLRAFYRPQTNTFDFKRFRHVIDLAVRNTNQVIDINHYPFDGARESNLNHRPIGVGVQGWANLLGELRLAFDSAEAHHLNQQIFETLSYQCWRTSCDLARESGPYPSMKWNGGSPLSQGIFPHEMWSAQPREDLQLPWEELRQDILQHGTKNSLTVALMPTASTSQIFGNQEGTEPFYAKYYSRKTKAGEFFVIDPYLVRDLMEANLWVGTFVGDRYVIPIRKKIFENQGSVQGILEIPEEIRQRHKTIWEIKARDLARMARDRAPWVDQSMSLNVNLKNSKKTKSQLEAYILNLALVQCLKTILYYGRTVQNSEALAFFKGVVNQQLKDEFMEAPPLPSPSPVNGPDLVSDLNEFSNFVQSGPEQKQEEEEETILTEVCDLEQVNQEDVVQETDESAPACSMDPDCLVCSS